MRDKINGMSKMMGYIRQDEADVGADEDEN
jgi:hypothetical protein